MGWLLSFGDKVRVVGPGDVVDSIRKIAKGMVGLYGEPCSSLTIPK